MNEIEYNGQRINFADTSDNNIAKIYDIVTDEYNQSIFELCVKNNFSRPVQKIIQLYSQHIASRDIEQMRQGIMRETFVIPNDMKKLLYHSIFDIKFFVWVLKNEPTYCLPMLKRHGKEIRENIVRVLLDDDDLRFMTFDTKCLFNFLKMTDVKTLISLMKKQAYCLTPFLVHNQYGLKYMKKRKILGNDVMFKQPVINPIFKFIHPLERHQVIYENISDNENYQQPRDLADANYGVETILKKQASYFALNIVNNFCYTDAKLLVLNKLDENQSMYYMQMMFVTIYFTRHNIQNACIDKYLEDRGGYTVLNELACREEGQTQIKDVQTYVHQCLEHRGRSRTV